MSHDTSELLALLRESSAETTDRINRAYSFAREVQHGKKRMSGEDYIVHSLETAKTLASLHMDPDTVIAGLLHDTLGEPGVTQEKLTKEFGEEVSALVSQQLELDRIKYQGDERYAENLRKLFMMTAKDVRVLIIRLAHRLHNVQTLKYIPEEKRGRIANETIEIYAPIANRLGMRKLKGELEDAAFPHAFPTEYELTLELLKEKEGTDQAELDRALAKLKRALTDNNIPADILYRQKQLFSTFRKLKRYNLDTSRLHDLHAVRVVVDSVAECYQALGVIHTLWRPILGELSDYIALPKPNGYQSIHTEVFTENGTIVEFQIRTTEMDEEAEYGIASHLAYTEAGKPKAGGKLGKSLQWVKQLLEWQKNNADSEQFLEELQMDFFRDRLFAYTPKGDVIELPEGASPIDFAYAIHSDIGKHAFGATVNGKFVGLDERLHNGDVVEITTRKNSLPSTKWLENAKTSLARRHIRNALNEKESKKPRP